MRVLSVFACASLLAAACLSACSGGGADANRGDGAGASAGDGTSDGAGGSGGGGGAGSSGASGSSGTSGGVEAPKETKVGTLTLTSTKYTIGTTPVEMGSAYGSFYRIPPSTAGTSAPCSTTTAGACVLSTCTFSTAKTDGGAPSIAYTNAGLVTVSGVLVNDGSMTLTPGGYGYETVSGNVAFFTGGESVRITAPGNPSGAPAFDTTLVAPSSVRVTSPAFDAQSRVTIGSGQSLPVVWQNGGSGEVVVQLAAGTSAKSASARCAFSSSAGQGTVPSSVVSAVAGVGAQTSIVVSSESREVKSPDGWNITLTLQAYGIRGGASPAISSGLLVVQ